MTSTAEEILDKHKQYQNATSLLYEDNGQQGTLKSATYFVLDAMEEYANQFKSVPQSPIPTDNYEQEIMDAPTENYSKDKATGFRNGMREFRDTIHLPKLQELHSVIEQKEECINVLRKAIDEPLRPLQAPSAYTLVECLTELKFGRPVAEQLLIGEWIEKLK